MVTDAVAQTMRQVVQSLSRAGIPAALMGGAAAGAWKHVRTTHDVDFLVEGTRDECGPILACLSDAGISPSRDPPVLVVDDHAFIPLTYEPPDTYLDIRVDLLLAESAFQKRVLHRRVETRLPRAGVDGDVLTCEDLILFKLLAGRIIDRADVAALIQFNHKDLDWKYLQGEADELGFLNELEQLCRESEIER